MSWDIIPQDNAVQVTMNSNKVNKQNLEFFQDIQETFDTLDQEHPGKPVIITGQGSCFSAGLDFDANFPMFQRQDMGELQHWFLSFSDAILRIMNSPRMTVAAINGHAFAGGFILALCCDFRYVADGNGKFSLNEVPIGIPMPSIFTELIRFRLGTPTAIQTILSGDVYNVDQAVTIGFAHEAVPADELLAKSLSKAQALPQSAWPAYVQSKKNLHLPFIEMVNLQSRDIDLSDTLEIISCPESIAAQEQAYASLKNKA